MPNPSTDPLTARDLAANFKNVPLSLPPTAARAMAFTSAPWKVYQLKTSDTWVISAKGYALCRPQNPDDASLIAAAPELFEACKIIVTWAKGNNLIGTNKEPPGVQEAIEAIRKAKPDCKLTLNLGD